MNEITSCSQPLVYFNQSGIIKSHAQYGMMNYTSNLYCEYIIKAPMNYKIIIRIEELDLEETNSCIFDYLLITDEYYTNVYTYCGYQVKASHSIEMNSSQVYIIFGTDDANHGHGFLLKYETVKNEALKSNNFYSCGLTFQLNEDVEYTDNKMESRIIGGELSRPGQWPWMVSVRENNQFRCGASLISSQWLLTAAHCFPKDVNLNNWIVHIGDFYLDWIDSEEILMNISSIFIHPNYHLRKLYDYDYALIKTASSIQYTSKRLPICILNSTLININELDRCYVAGWGSSEDSPISNELRHLYIPLLNLTVCNQTEAYQGKLTETMICAGYIRGGKDSCQGDSGSPLMCQLHNTTDHVWYQIGIVSFGKSCAAAGTPGIYSNLTFVNNWISSIIQSYE
ncbi:Serine protease 56 [Schistosoma haematobium]|uniref:Serine protease 56 n=1 Tax=Schistosoma haematobium TaxID=6185 RepID=A0A922IPB8_SCHHA|nr:Serine protease 56 [Schistosoma haematobium]KAH9583931.1 Serine protease 56 [Schistosoma haematobium]CAH8570185.1 unnamed protein product [Schistosoma haematobium]CAH8576701.1 unnamed protein product [Schistosoma haematobium]